MARRESGHLVQQDCFLREWYSPFGPVMAKQRRCAGRAGANCQVRPQAKARGPLQASWLALLQVNYPPIPQKLFLNSPMKGTLLVQPLAKLLLLELQANRKD